MIGEWKKEEQLQDKWQINLVMRNLRDGSGLCGFIR